MIVEGDEEEACSALLGENVETLVTLWMCGRRLVQQVKAAVCCHREHQWRNCISRVAITIAVEEIRRASSLFIEDVEPDCYRVDVLRSPASS